ncbi:MAG: hypothetical protein JNK52_09370 [Zoogloeaceae bacterium]|nr:hypothetical protein [Zoogloeaceae bacterium]
MLPRHVVAEHQVESLDNLKHAAMIGIDAVHTLTVLSMQFFRAHLIAPFNGFGDGNASDDIEIIDDFTLTRSRRSPPQLKGLAFMVR